MIYYIKCILHHTHQISHSRCERVRQWLKTGDVPQQGEVPQRQAADHFVPAPHHLVPLPAGGSFTSWWEILFSLLQVFPRYHPSLSLKAIKPWFAAKRGGFQVKECTVAHNCHILNSSGQGADAGGCRGGQDLPLLPVSLLRQQQQLRTR